MIATLSFLFATIVFVLLAFTVIDTSTVEWSYGALAAVSLGLFAGTRPEIP